MVQYNSDADLGWTAGQNVNSQLATQLGLMSSGDILVLDDMYDYTATSSVDIPAGVILAGGKEGAGLDFSDTGNGQNPYFVARTGSVVRDLTFTCSNSPDTGTNSINPQPGTDYHQREGLFVINDNNVSFVNCYISGQVTIFFDVRAGNNCAFTDMHFFGTFIQIRSLGQVDGLRVTNCLFDNPLGDGIKTAAGSNQQHTVDALIIDSVFIRPNRDGIDTTGGFYQSEVRDTIFVGGFSSMDIKSIYDSTDDFALGGSRNDQILLLRCEFIDPGVAALIVTTLDRNDPLLLDANGESSPDYPINNWCVQGITSTDCIIERDPAENEKALVLLKGARDITWNNLSALGNINPAIVRGDNTSGGSFPDYNLPTDASGGISGTETFGSYRGAQTDEYYRGLAGTDWGNILYPTAGGSPTPAITSQTLTCSVSVA